VETLRSERGTGRKTESSCDWKQVANARSGRFCDWCELRLLGFFGLWSLSLPQLFVCFSSLIEHLANVV